MPICVEVVGDGDCIPFPRGRLIHVLFLLGNVSLTIKRFNAILKLKLLKFTFGTKKNIFDIVYIGRCSGSNIL